MPRTPARQVIYAIIILSIDFSQQESKPAQMHGRFVGEVVVVVVGLRSIRKKRTDTT
jgi:hypothetical protein